MKKKLLIDSTNNVLNHNSSFIKSDNIWIWIGLLAFVIIVLIVLFSKNTKLYKQLAKDKFKQEIQSGDIDFGNIVNSSFNAKPLYDELIRKCHPDRFVQNEDKNKIALSLSQEITKNKNDIKRLIELKEQAIKQLNINL